jgi:PKD repeat protein
MKKIKLHTLALCFGVLGLITNVKAANTTYTYTGGGHPELLTNWGKTTATLGANPASFTAANQIFQFKGASSATLGAAWTVSGSSSKIVVGDGTNAFTFSDGGKVLTTVGIDVANKSTFTIQNTTTSLGSFVPKNGTPGSTINYAASSGTQTIFGTTYYNLTISGAAIMNLGGTTTVNKVLTLNAGCALTLNGIELDLNGTITGSGTITGDISASVYIGAATGTFGTINFTSGGQMLNQFDLGSSAAGTLITLGTDLTVIDDGGGQSILNLSSGTLNLNGHKLISDVTCITINFGGTITGSTTSSLQLNCASTGAISGSLLMDQTTSGTTNALSNLTLNDGGAGQTLTLGSALSIVDSICPTSGTIDASGGSINLVFTSATKTGRVGVMNAAGSISGSTITSNIQRPAGNTDWVLMGYPGVVPAASDFTVYQNQFPMECLNCPDGFSQSFTSVDSWSETTGLDLTGATGYTGISNTTDAMSNGTGYWFYMGQAIPTTIAIPIAVTGAVQSAAGTGISMPLTANHTGYNLVANPVPSPISWTALRAGNGSVSTTYQVYSPNFPGGANYTTWDESTGGDGSGLLSDIIAQGQGFYVVASAGTSLTLFEGAKRNGGSQGLAKLANPTVQSSGINYFKFYVTGSNNQFNSTTFEFNTNAVAGQDMYDAQKFPAGTVGALAVSSSSFGTDLTINALPGLTQNYSIPVKMTTGTTGSYQISPADIQHMPTGVCIKLHDNYTGTDYDVLQGAFSVTLNDTETVARFTLNVTVTPLAITTNANQATCHNTHDGLITAVGNDAGPWNYTWKDATGAVVKTTLNKATPDSLTGLNNGVYTVEVTTVGSCNNATQTFTVTAPAAPVSLFTAPLQVNVGSNVNFVNNSTDATNYTWNFGDGNMSSQQIPTYAYNSPGTYTITLSAINASCNDTVKSKQVIVVNATTGIKQANVGSGDINLSKDATGNYIQFDYANQTKVNITVYNVLGQTLLNNAAINVVNDKIYLNIADNKNQVLYVTITNLTNNQQTTKKFVND